MKTTLPAKIETKEHAIAFLTELTNNGEAYHPEDNAHEVFCSSTKEENDKLNELMDQIYDLDGNNGNHKDPAFDPCYVLLALDKLNDLHNRNLLNDVLLNVIKTDVDYTGYLGRNPHTKDWELSISDGDSIWGKYIYSRFSEVGQDIERLAGFGINVEEE